MRKLFTFFSVLLATTALWAYDFQLEEYQHGTPPTNGCDSVETLRLTNIPPEEYTPTEEDCKIYYTSPNNYAVMPNDMNAFGANIISNICKNKQGVITFDQPVKYIGDKAFYRNSYLTSITLPNSVISIGTDAFWHCENLNSISFSQNLTHINYGAFRYCENLNSISLPENLTHIGESAFRYCTSLSSISISKKLESIGEDAFWDCDSLCDIVVDADNLYFDSRNNCNAIIETATNTLILGGRNTSIPTSVTSIGYYAFQGRSSLTSIVIPSNVKTINIGAFYDCRNLTSIEMYEGVTTIGGSAFRDCSSLASIKIPSTVTSFGVAPFQQCTSLVSIVVDDNNKIYDSRDNCNAIVQTATNTLIVGCKNTTIPNSVTSIGSSAFSECSSLTSITIPNSVTSLEGSAFSECSSLTSITIPTSVTNIENFVFWRCSSLDSITLSDNLINIGKYAFSETPITSIKIPKDVQTIGEYAFKKCSDLNVIYCEAINPPSVENITDNYNITLCVPRESLSEYKTHSEWGKFANIICIGDEIIPPVTEIPLDTTLVQITICEGDYYEWNGEALTEAGEYILVDIGSDGRDSISILNLEISTLCNEETHQIHYTSTDGKIVNPRLPGMIKNTYENGEGLIILKKAVTSVTYCAFHECSTLVSITLPNTVTYIDSYAFYGCFSLQSINIPDSVSWIGEWAFGNCHSLASITIPGAVKIIEGSTFSNCRKLASLTIGEGVEEIHGYSFYNCTSLTEINIPNSVKFIDNNAFLECDAVASIFIGKNVMSIGEDSFSNCGSKTLTSIAVHDDNKVYDSRENCNALIESSTNTLVLGCKTTIIPDGVTSIGSRAFEYRTHIDSIVIPDCVTHIGEGAFGYCRYLYKVTLGSGIKTIENAFYSCSSLNTVYCYAMTPPNGTGNIKSTVALYVPCSSLEAYKSDSLWGKFTNIQCFETTPPSAPQDTTIYHPTEYATICEGTTFVWMGMEFTAAGMFISEEIVEDENYIYHYIYTLELQVLPSSIDTIVVEAYDSYEWHGVVYTESGTYIYEEHCYQEILELTIIDTPTPPESEIPTEGIGVFSVGEGKTVTFSRGNLQYTQSTDTWSFAENQWDMIGTDNVTGGSVESNQYGAYYKQGDALADKIDLFCWSASNTTAPFGVSTSADYNDYSGSFVDWGTNQIGADAPNTWRTLTYDEWDYLRHTRTNANALCGIAQVNGVNGFILLPDSWACPDGVTFKSGFHSHSDYSVKAYGQYQTFTADQWSKLEKSGAVFLPVAGDRLGTCVYDVQNHGYYWSATEDGSDLAYYFGFYSVGAYMGYGSRNGGYSVRLVKDVNSTTPEPPVEPEGPCSNIQELDWKNGLRLSDFSAKTWYKMYVGDVKGSNFEVRWINDEPCVATWTTAYLSECLNTTDWSEIEWESLVTITEILELNATCTVSSSFFDNYSQIGDYIYVYVGSKVLDCDSEPQDTIFYTYSEYATICEGETYIWRMGMEFTEAGTYRRDEIVEDENYTYHHIYILELTVIPSEKVVLVEEAYDSYEWHGVVYTESGSYTYSDPYNPCVIEELHLTIIDTPTPSEPQDTTIYHPVDITICENDLPYIFTGRESVIELTEAGTYTYEEIVEDENYIYHHIYTLELTVIAPMILVWPVEAYDSYEWHGEVYTESGVYLYEEYCFQEILELTIIPSEDKKYVYEHHNYLVCDADIFVDPITGSTHVISSLIPFSLTWSDTIIGTNIDTIHTFNITPIVYPEPLTEDMLYAIGAVPKLVAGEKVDLMGTTELIMAYYQMHDQHDIADVIGVEWVAGHDVVLDAEQTTHTMVLEVWDECDDIIPMEFTFPVSKKDSEPQDTTIYIYHTEDVTICEGETYIWWMGKEFTEEGIYTYEEIVVEDDYIYHYIYTLHLMVLPHSLDMYEVTAYDSYEWHGVVYTESGVYTYSDPYNPCVIEELHLTIIDTPTPPTEYYVTICEGETYIWNVNGLSYYQAGTYTHVIVEDEDYIYRYTLELTVLPYETIEYEVEAYDSYVWHDIVYTESGTYTYQYECTTEVLYLTIIPSEDNQGEVVVEPSTNSVTITWQKEDDADTYIIVIKQGDKVVCTLIFDAEGNLVSVNYLPGRESNKHGIQHAGLTSDSFQYTITGLTPPTDYTYTVTATDDSDNTISSYSGEFTTHHATSVENTNSQSPTIDCQKILYKDHIYILRDGKTYTIMGQEI